MSEEKKLETMALLEAAESASTEAVTESKTDDEIRRLKKVQLIKVSVILFFVALVMIFATLGWFSMNRETRANSGSVKIATQNYEISFLPSGSDGIYYDDYHSIVREQTNSNAMVWQMTSSNKMDNYNSSTDKGIHPGSCGVISFKVTPKIATVNLKYSFEITGYQYSETVENKGQENETTTRSMTPLASNSSLAKYLNGHILLFEGRTGTSPDNYVYSDPILSNADMERIISSKTYSGAGSETTVNIYWVWPNTLSTLIYAKTCSIDVTATVDSEAITYSSSIPANATAFTYNETEYETQGELETALAELSDGDYAITITYPSKINVTEDPFTVRTSNNYTKIVTNILTYPDYYLKGVSRSDASSLSEQYIVENYDIYGDYYDQADNDIGMEVNFILLKLNVSEVNSGGV